MCCFIFRCSSAGGGEAVGWDETLANSYKMTKSSRVRCVSKCVFFYSLLLEFEKQVVLLIVPSVVLSVLPHT